MRANHVASRFPDGFGRVRIGHSSLVNVGATGNAVATIPVVSGTTYIVRQITVANANKSIGTANVAIYTSNDANASNIVADATVLANVTSNSTYQDLTLDANCATTVWSAGSLYVKVNTAVSGGTCTVSVYGDVVQL